MPWQQIDRQFVKQDQPGFETVWFWDTTDRGGGELLLWLDGTGAIGGFQLSYEQWPSGRHYVCQWRQSSGLQTGLVDEGGGAMRLGLKLGRACHDGDTECHHEGAAKGKDGSDHDFTPGMPASCCRERPGVQPQLCWISSMYCSLVGWRGVERWQ